MACQIVGFRPLGTLSAEPHRFYTQIVVYHRDGKHVAAYRRTYGRPHDSTEMANWPVSVSKLFAGHCAWIARDIAEREARQVKRYMTGAPHRLAEPILKTA